ncbi:MAG TPA: stage IV sporulation protein A [Candidatus Faecousia faecipullorum]|nr:stage IV sporulation protein A [Candidatus Faecousia faecipullorum]
MDRIYADIAARTGGNIYVGVVGPVRTGKSTLIKRIMEELVIPGMEDPFRKERARDELPQSGSGRTIMTSEPKFVPEEAVEISPDGMTNLRVRFIDSVGYMVEGAVGAEEEGNPRMVTTPWFDHEIPMTQAAELGTKKVMEEHSSIGLVVTTDGTVTDIPREDYVNAERKAVSDMKKTGKPFLVIVNSRDPAGEAAASAKEYIHKQYGVEPLVMDCLALDAEGIAKMFRSLLYTFPMTALQVYLPRWLDALERTHPVKSAIYEALLEHAGEIENLGQAQSCLAPLQDLPEVQDYSLRSVDLASGIVSCAIVLPEGLYYEILSAKAGLPIENDAQLLSLLMELAGVKQEYDKIADALSAVRATGYGVVMPTAGEMKLETPEIIRKGGAFGVKLKAGAPSIHMIRVDIDTEISPMVGDEKQSRDLITHLTGEDPAELWQSNIFGKSVYDLIQEGLTAKLIQMPDDVRGKFRGTLTRIVNEGATGLICLIL